VSRKKRITLRDVARQAGVSPTAVSFAYNAPHQLSQSTRERILATADDLGYQPHPVARTLATGRTNTIGLVMPTSLDWILHDPLFGLILGEIGTVCDEEKVRILIVPAVGEVSPGMLSTIAADGFVLFSIHRTHPLGKVVERANRPLVMINGDENLRVPMFNVDDFNGAYTACKHLLDKGHRRIAVGTLAPREDGVIIPTFERRMLGYEAAVRDAGLPPATLRPVFIRGLLSMGEESFAKIWSLEPRPTAVLCVSDVRALGVLNGARKAGIAVPDDLAIVGFDNLPDSAVSTPPLTTLKQDLPGRIRLALGTLFALVADEINDDNPPPPHITPLDLVVREST